MDSADFVGCALAETLIGLTDSIVDPIVVETVAFVTDLAMLGSLVFVVETAAADTVEQVEAVAAEH